MLAKGAQTTTQLPVSGLSGPGDETPLLGIAVDSHGNIYLADNKNEQVIELKV